MVNKTLLVGNVGADATINTVGESQVVNFNLCTTENWKSASGEKMKKDTWWSCAYWVKNTVIAQYIKKGSLLHVEGRAEAKLYKNREGVQVAQLQLTVSEIKLLSKPQPKDTTPTPETPQQPQNDIDPNCDLPF